ncbi:hypothetical protein LMH87_009905 [Akanthomyces muscarius]|uniref:histidine kinase n=1 Tax=Akanthomyces muscarius TaxID=2231603 RepID=A0A9W8ULG2_AKAMU|nr:hypothetical protein LMH87_009905 [Akanthomyces muscarius]KAJ4153418.1 hypothetical protein LMH87_009905 [Akanthomyces muscarius]
MAVRPVKIVSEAMRERETFRYDSSLPTDFHHLSDGDVLPSSELANASDAILSALAQLGAYQTKTDRAFISLFDATHQYIIAETVSSMRITPDLPSAASHVPLALRGNAIPRHQGTCDHVLYLSTTGTEGASELPLSFVPNLVVDPRFATRPYCQFGDGGQFYAGVPIRTRRGINIGAFCVMSQTTPEGWDDQCPRYLRDISRAIMDHLENKRSKVTSRMNERMNRGLGSFIEGKATLAGWQSGPNADAFMDHDKHEGGLNTRQQHMERDWQDAKDRDDPNAGSRRHSTHVIAAESQTPVIEIDPSTTLHEYDTRHSIKSNPRKQHSHAKQSKSEEDGPSEVFSRAANILREAFEVEGSVFVDVTVGAYALSPDADSPAPADADDIGGQLSSTSGSDDQAPPLHEAPDVMSDVLGFSTTEASSINGTQLAQTVGKLPNRFIAKLLRRYPNGKIFNFDAVGDLQPSDSSDDEGKAAGQPTDIAASTHNGDGEDTDGSQKALRNRRPGRFSRQREGEHIHQAFPGARSVAFFPMRNSKRDRWLAGGFIYTLAPTRVFSIEGELSFLRAFERVITAELLSLEQVQVDRAKSDALGSLSHELRSPLHGVILGTELLNDTELSGFQGNTTHMIETCCRTLLDTIDHMLDYSKVNSFASKDIKGPPTSTAKRPGMRQKLKSNQFGKKLHINARLDGIIEEVAQSVFAGFNFQHMSIRQLSKHATSGFSDTAAHNQLDFTQAMEQLSPTLGTLADQMFQLGRVSVYLCIDQSCNWMFNMQPGAIRRIFMNLFGNALKYTQSGSIRVSLTQQPHASNHASSERLVKLTVQDTGKGMSKDYMQHRMFVPFSQEDELTPGTGLGLSLVRTIVSQLCGRIHVKSRIGVGTTVVVTLPLEQSLESPDTLSNLPEEDKLFEEQRRELKGLRIRIHGFDGPGAGSEERIIIESICRDWLQLELVPDHGSSPDIVLRSASALPETFEQSADLARTPNVVLCKDALTAYQRLRKYDTAGQGGIFEFISQPIGPRTFAKSLLLAYKRWMGLSSIKAPPRPAGPSRAHSTLSSNLMLPPRPSRPSRAHSTYSAGQPPKESQDEVWQPLVSPSGTAVVSEPRADDTANALEPTEDAPPPTPLLLDDAESETESKILLVDDNHINLKILAAFMGKLGRAYEMVVNGKEAVDAYTARPEQYDAILMDISMPVMDGLEATRRIRAFEHRSRCRRMVAVLALTGLASDSIHKEASDSGVDMFLTKPVRLKTLSEALQSINVLNS